METIEIFEKLGLVLGLSAIFAIAGVFVLRRVLELLINRDLEKFKSELERESVSHKIRYERLHGERMEVIKNTYKKLSETYRNFSSFMAPIQPVGGEEVKLEKRRKAAESVIDLTKYFEDNRIFFNETLAMNFDNLLLEFQDIWSDFQLAEDLREDDRKESNKTWIQTWKRLNKEVPEIKSELERQFRSIIGVGHEK